MYTYILLLGIFILSILVMIIFEKVPKLNNSKLWSKLAFPGLVFLVFFLSICILGILELSNVISDFNKEQEYTNKLNEKSAIELRIINTRESINSNNLDEESVAKLYYDIIVFNDDLKCIKDKCSNPWIDRFNNEKIASIDYIDINILE